MLATVASATLYGVEGRQVQVEVHLSPGLPAFTVVGLPDASVRESRDRVRAAVLSSGLTWPTRRITVNLAPSGVRKGGSGLDLPIAVGALAVANVVSLPDLADTAFIGELGLDGSLRAVPGMVPMVGALDARRVVVPLDCLAEARLVSSGARGARSLAELLGALGGRHPWPEPHAAAKSEPRPVQPDLAEVRGQVV
ncbi:MAG: magnesium chelatase domain-containing protein, partial [Acidimicrobiales bacterium]